MKICLILEGCYPYIRGGVSAWVHDYVKSSPETRFVLWTIHANRDALGPRLYEVPENVVELREIFLEDAFRRRAGIKRAREEELRTLVGLLSRFLSEDAEAWGETLRGCRRSRGDTSALSESEALLDFAVRMADAGAESIGLSDMFYGLRSMLLPLLHILRQEIPEADIYHSAVTGYGGLLGALAHLETGKPFVLTEHGIYPREREEELMQSDWITEGLKDIWIRMFYNLSRCAYEQATRVTALFPQAKRRQCEIGCEASKCRIVPNGIHFERFGAIGPKPEDGHVNIGAFIRFAPIKDVKTLIRAFHNLSRQVPEAVLYILGGTDDREYEQSCRELIRRLGVANILIEGHVDTAAYLRRMDFTVMTSISEGQPLAILESLAAGRPCVATDVGNCRELLEQPEDDCGQAGLCCMPMDTEAITRAMERLCRDKALRERFGRSGRDRIARYYAHDVMMARYFQIYEEVQSWQG